MSGETLAIRLDYGLVVSARPAVAREVATVLSRPVFARHLIRVSARRNDRWVDHAFGSIDTIEARLIDPRNESACLDNGRDGDLTATAEIQCGSFVRPKGPAATRFMAYVAMPFVADDLEDVLDGVCALAKILDVAAGFITLEPSYGLAHRAAIGGSEPVARSGLSERRTADRRAREWRDDELTSRVVVEWGLFFGAGHLAQISEDDLRASGAFARVKSVVEKQLAFVTVTTNPLNELNAEFDDKLEPARQALSKILIMAGSASNG